MRYAGISVDVRPVGGDQRLTAVRQNENELQAVAHTRVPEYLQRLSLKWVARAGNGHPLWKLLMVGSLWWFPWKWFRTRPSSGPLAAGQGSGRSADTRA